MSKAARILWVCAATAVLLFVALAVLSKSSLEPEGLLIFDSRLFGYSEAEARAYLEAISQTPEAVALYLGTFHQLDTVFPLLLALSLGGAIWLNTRGRNGALRALMLLAPLGYLGADLAENTLVGRMLSAGAVVFTATIEWASFMTQTKWALLAVTLLLVGATWIKRRKPL